MIKSKILQYIPSFLMFFFVAFGFKEYIVWSQIDEGFIDGDVTQYFENIVSHTSRLVLMHPIKYYSGILGFEQNLVFSYVVFLIFVFINYRIIIWSKYNFGIKNHYKISLSINFVLLIFFILINGRNSFSFLGNVLLFDAFLLVYFSKDFFKFPILAALAGFFCNVSSGTYAVFAINLVFNFLLVFFKCPFSRLFWKTVILLFFSVIVFLPILLAGIIKNLEFYDGSILKMLSHGYGALIIDNLYIAFIILPFLMFFSFLVSYYLVKPSLSSFKHIRLIFLLTALIGGLFGYSSLVGALPVLLFLICTFFWTNNNNFFNFTYV